MAEPVATAAIIAAGKEVAEAWKEHVKKASKI